MSWGSTQVMRIEHRQIRDHLEAIHNKVQILDPESDLEERLLLSILSAHRQKEENLLYTAIDRSINETERTSIFTAMKNILSMKRINRRLVLHILLVGLLPLALGLSLTYHYGIQALRSTIGANFKTIAIETGKRMDNLIGDEIQKLRGLTKVPIVVVREVSQANQAYRDQSEETIRQRLLKRDREWTQIQEASPASPDFLKTESSRYLRSIVELGDHSVVGVLMTDRYGGLVAASALPKKSYFGEDLWWKAIMERGDVYVSGVLSPGLGSFEAPEGTIEIALPIRDLTDNRILGVVKAEYSFGLLASAISEVRIGQTGHVMLFDSDGTPLICPILPREQHLVNPALLSKILLPAPGWTIAPDDAHGARDTIVGYAPVPMVNRLGGSSLGGRSWHVFIRQHPDESYAPAYALLKKVALLGGVLVGLLALSGLYVGSRISKPIHELQRGAKLIGEGQLDHRLRIETQDELEELAGEFNRMAEKIKRYQEELAALNEMIREINSPLEISRVLRLVTEKARELLGSEVAALCLVDETDQTLTLHSVSGPQEALCRTQVPVDSSPVAAVLERQEAVRCDVANCAAVCNMIVAPFRVSHLVAPLRVGNRAMGAVCVSSSKSGAFSEKEAGLLTKLASSAAIALENARLYQQSEHIAALEERHRIAAEMHDGLAQTLSCLNLKVEQATEQVETGDIKEAIAELKRISDAIHQAAEEVRRSIASLQEGPPARQSLQERLAEEATRFAKEYEPLIQLGSSLEAPFLLPSSECDQVLHVVREALLNACRHAQAAHIIIRLEGQDHQARVIVEDDGRGFDPKAPPVDESSHFGLSIMRARAARINGQIAVQSAPGQGTRVVLSWPIEQVLGRN